ncbi:DUF1488 domain-containing protein [Enterovibrio nigricans]|uniref:Uncharacterized protein n=1 Tax=Enterovibrio nigricans DSM 22720 TaxID=1121868 RepID=A0A1T4VJR3_9GAMM|nr:DUF1488 domain-containing protein [Enterovibrio nigricans]PKF49697.1 DUF1488 domain-containing protein [Enterovibrio nigricans]SKA65135.1 Protein of unknown function [Enterovibrio nigricans DSM 22720]
MNQNILFPDLHNVDDARQAVSFHAQQAGGLIPCFVQVSDLEKRTGSELDSKEAILNIFNEYRFDYEELAENAIEEEDFNGAGEIWVS